jgi:hypothetical protein
VRRKRTLSQVVTAATETLVGAIYVSWPGSVIAYNAVTQTADVQPTLTDVRFDPDSGQPYAEPWPVFHGVPVMWPRGGGATLAFNLKAGDSVNLIAWDYDPKSVIQPNAGSQTFMPTDIRKLAGHAWRAIPEALFPLPTAEATAAQAGYLLGLVGDPSQIQGVPGSLLLGAGATIPVALATPLTTFLTALNTWVTAVTAAATAGSGAPDPTGAKFAAFATALAGLGPSLESAISTAKTQTPATVAKAK